MEDLDYFSCKPGLFKSANKKCKFGVVKRSGATLRRSCHTNRHSCHSGASVIVKHVSRTDQWTADDVKENFEFSDGGMDQFCSVSKVASSRGKGVRSAIARNGSNLLYSMNKRKRWLLPDMLRDEINRENHPSGSDIDLTVVEREICTNRGLYDAHSNKPDTVRVTSSSTPPEDYIPRRKARKSKRKKYGFSTDMLGLSQKRERSGGNEVDSSTDEDLKPQVTYEICKPRPIGSSSNFKGTLKYGYYPTKKSRSSNKREFQCLYRESQDTATTFVQPQIEGKDNYQQENQGSPCQSSSFSVDSWLPDKTNSFHLQRRKTNGCKFSKKVCTKKDRVVFEIMNQTDTEHETNQRNLTDSAVNDTYRDRIEKNEENYSTNINVSLQSLQALEGLFYEPLGKETSPKQIHGVNAVRGTSRPVKYAFQMKQHLTTTSKSGQIDSATCYLILQSLSDPNHCSNKENCYYTNTFCVCHDYVPMILKTLVLSDEKGHQTNGKVWNDRLKAILTREHPTSKGLYVAKILNIAVNLLKTTAEMHVDSDGKETNQKIVTAPKLSLYVRKVLDETSDLLGFHTTQITETGFSAQLNSQKRDDSINRTESLITNTTPPDYCEICYVVLEDSTGFRASSMAACNHWFCTDCWRHHTASLARLVSSSPIQCPGFECCVAVDDVTLMSFLPGDVIAKYRKRRRSNALKRSDNLQHCPRCSNIVNVNLPKTFKATDNNAALSCTCGAHWCSGCKGEPHWPASCQSAKLYWEELRRSIVARQLQLITSVSGRKCPECKERIEKNGGCQMVTCICTHTFCWRCMKSFDDCMYQCKVKENTLETWEIDTKWSKFSAGMRESITLSTSYQSSKDHKIRIALSRKTASRWISFKYPTVPFNESLSLIKKTEEELEKALLSCDSFRQIMQYLCLRIAYRQPSNKHQRAKLNRFLKRLKQLILSTEHIILSWNNRSSSKRSPDQRLKKQLETAKVLVKFLQGFISRCDVC